MRQKSKQKPLNPPEILDQKWPPFFQCFFSYLAKKNNFFQKVWKSWKSFQQKKKNSHDLEKDAKHQNAQKNTPDSNLGRGQKVVIFDPSTKRTVFFGLQNKKFRK